MLNQTSTSSFMLHKNNTFLHSVAFVLGFGIFFTILGASVGLIGRALGGFLPVVQQLGGLVLIIFGLIMVGIIGWLTLQIENRPKWQAYRWGQSLLPVFNLLTSLMYTERRVHRQGPNRGYSTSFLTGIFFSAGWTPCVGPILTAVLLLSSQQQTIVQGTALLAVYSLGLGLPFLATGAALGKMSGAIRQANRYAGVISKISGILLIIVGWLLLTDQLRSLLGTLILEYGQGLVELESYFQLGAGEVSFPLAFLAGVLSFFSPCILPLVPIYIGYLSGVTLVETTETIEVA